MSDKNKNRAQKEDRPHRRQNGHPSEKYVLTRSTSRGEHLRVAPVRERQRSASNHHQTIAKQDHRNSLAHLQHLRKYLPRSAGVGAPTRLADATLLRDYHDGIVERKHFSLPIFVGSHSPTQTQVLKRQIVTVPVGCGIVQSGYLPMTSCACDRKR